MLDFFYCYAALLCACIWLCPIALCIKVCINIAFLYSSNLKLGSTLFQCSLSSYLAFPKCTGWESGQEGDVTLFRTTGNVMAGKMLHLNTLNQSTVCVWFLVLDCLWSAQKEIGISIFQMAAFIVHVCCGGFFFFFNSVHAWDKLSSFRHLVVICVVLKYWWLFLTWETVIYLVVCKRDVHICSCVESVIELSEFCAATLTKNNSSNISKKKLMTNESCFVFLSLCLNNTYCHGNMCRGLSCHHLQYVP